MVASVAQSVEPRKGAKDVLLFFLTGMLLGGEGGARVWGIRGGGPPGEPGRGGAARRGRLAPPWAVWFYTR